ncbi:hypothetical protein Tco_0735231 [Tanacetum coccineum]
MAAGVDLWRWGGHGGDEGVRMEMMTMLADLISNFPHVSVLGSGFDLKAYSDSDLLDDAVLKSSGLKVSWLTMMFSMIRYHFIRDHILKGDIELHFVPTELQLADIFTKPLAEPSFTRLVAELGMLNIEKQVSDKKKALSDL